MQGPIGWIDAGSAIDLLAVADASGTFTRWEGDVPGGVSTEPGIQVDVQGPQSIVARFSLSYYLLTVQNAFGATLIGTGGDFLPALSFGLEDSYAALATGDFDYDGDNDVAGLTDGGDIHVYRNTMGTGSYWNMDPLPAGLPDASTLAGGDIDGDGQADLVTGGNALIWWSRTPGEDGEWTPHTVESGPAPSQVCQVGDLDGDGDIDLAAVQGALPAGFVIRWYENLDAWGRSWSTHDIATDPTAVPASDKRGQSLNIDIAGNAWLWGIVPGRQDVPLRVLARLRSLRGCR